MSRVNQVSLSLLLAGLLALGLAVFLPVPRFHPVTPAMLAAAAARSGSLLPEPVRSAAADRPVVLVFIMEGCPCSESAEPFFQQLHGAFGSRASFLGVINGDRAAANSWAERHRSPYPVVADSDLRIIRACGAERSAYVALVNQEGRIERLWPGYSSEMLSELSVRLARLTGLSAPTTSEWKAPRAFASGCLF